MNREEVVAKLIEFAAMAYNTPADQITEDTDLSTLGVQSMQRVAMSSSIENEYDVMVPVAKFGNFKTLGALVDFVMEEAEE